MSALGNAIGSNGGLYMITFNATDPSGTVSASKSYTFTPHATDPARITFHNLTSTQSGSGAFIPARPGGPRG